MAAKKKLGRPTAMTNQVVSDVANALAGGASVKSAAKAAGISEPTYHRWVAAGEGEAAESHFRYFRERTTRARAEGHVALAAAIRDAAVTDWRAAAWLLERAEPETYALKQILEHQGPGGGPIRTEDTGAPKFDYSKLSKEQKRQLVELLDAADA